MPYAVGVAIVQPSPEQPSPAFDAGPPTQPLPVVSEHTLTHCPSCGASALANRSVTAIDIARWEPDEHLLAAVLCGAHKRIKNLSHPDRCWVVAGLIRQGLTSKEMADRLKCARRTVLTIKADPFTQVCLILQRETEAFTSELRLRDVELRNATVALAECERERDRWHEHFANLLDAHMAGQVDGTFRCGHPKTPYNTWTSEKTGKSRCRWCHRERESERRALNRGNQVATPPVCATSTVGTMSPVGYPALDAEATDIPVVLADDAPTVAT